MVPEGKEVWISSGAKKIDLINAVLELVSRFLIAFSGTSFIDIDLQKKI